MKNKLLIELTEEEANTVLLGLLELPAKMSIELIEKIRESALRQIKEGEKKQPESQE